MAERGGYRKPKKGAQVSPPGALSKRKERENVKGSRQDVFGMGGYGSTKEAKELASGATFAGKTPTPQLAINTSPGVRPQPNERITPLIAETERPDEMPEFGMPFGAGPGPMDLGLPAMTGSPESPQKQDLRRLNQYLPMIELVANSENAPQTLRTFVKHLRSL